MNKSTVDILNDLEKDIAEVPIRRDSHVRIMKIIEQYRQAYKEKPDK